MHVFEVYLANKTDYQILHPCILHTITFVNIALETVNPKIDV